MNLSFRFDCIFYYVSDLDRAVRFYTEVLNLHLMSRDVVARFDIDGVLFELVPTNDSSRLSGEGNARLTLGVDDLRQVSTGLASKGVIVSALNEVQNGLLASFTDPDGNEIILWQYTSSTPRRGSSNGCSDVGR